MTTPATPRPLPYYAWMQAIREGVCEGCSDDALAVRYPRIPSAFIAVIASALRRADTEQARAERAERELRRVQAQQAARAHRYIAGIKEKR